VAAGTGAATVAGAAAAGRIMYAVVTPVSKAVPVTSAMQVVTSFPNGLMIGSSCHRNMTPSRGRRIRVAAISIARPHFGDPSTPV
jgi:hypothetical protein